MSTVDGRRVRVVLFRGVRGFVVRWVDSCSGCYETEDGHAVGYYPRDANGVTLGAGCDECGHTGKRRRSAWVPFNPRDYERAFPPETAPARVAA
jgi:hypothetical protein